jgi:hypothetical protein
MDLMLAQYISNIDHGGDPISASQYTQFRSPRTQLYHCDFFTDTALSTSTRRRCWWSVGLVVSVLLREH